MFYLVRQLRARKKKKIENSTSDLTNQIIPLIENIPVDVGMKSEVGVASISLAAKSIGRHCYMYMRIRETWQLAQN